MMEVRIQSSFLLNERFELPTEGLAEVVDRYRKAWEKVSQKTITGLEKVTGLPFSHSLIDCYIANSQSRDQISHPLVIGGGYTNREFLNALIHSLIHILADDNQQDYNWHEVAKKLWPKQETFVAYHIMTNAVQEALYTDIMNNTDLVINLISESRDLNRGETHAKAWDVVEEKGYQKVLQDLKDNSFVTDKKFA